MLMLEYAPYGIPAHGFSITVKSGYGVTAGIFSNAFLTLLQEGSRKAPEGSRNAPGRLQEGSKKAPGRLQEGSRKAPGRLQESSRKAPGKFQEGSRKAPGRLQEGFRKVQEGARKARDTTRHTYPSTRMLKRFARLKFRCWPKEFQEAQGRARRKSRKTRIPYNSRGNTPQLFYVSLDALPSLLAIF